MSVLSDRYGARLVLGGESSGSELTSPAGRRASAEVNAPAMMASNDQKEAESKDLKVSATPAKVDAYLTNRYRLRLGGGQMEGIVRTQMDFFNPVRVRRVGVPEVTSGQARSASMFGDWSHGGSRASTQHHS